MMPPPMTVTPAGVLSVLIMGSIHRDADFLYRLLVGVELPGDLIGEFLPAVRGGLDALRRKLLLDRFVRHRLSHQVVEAIEHGFVGAAGGEDPVPGCETVVGQARFVHGGNVWKASDALWRRDGEYAQLIRLGER